MKDGARSGSLSTVVCGMFTLLEQNVWRKSFAQNLLSHINDRTEIKMYCIISGPSVHGRGR
jgi:hypothetical protein